MDHLSRQVVDHVLPCACLPHGYAELVLVQAVQVKLPSFLEEDNPASANEVWLRLHSDPLFAVRPLVSCTLLMHG